MRYIIIGNSFAGIFAAESIRQVDREGEIIIIGDEEHRLYSRALIHEYLAGLIDESKMYLRDEEIYEILNINCLTGRRVTKLIPESQQVVIDENEQVEYDKLLIATGGAPFIPPGIKGLDEYPECVFTFTKMADAQKLSLLCDKVQNVIVLGAGLIGMQAAEAIAHRGKNVSVIELADHVLPMVVDEIAAKIIREQMEKQGVKFHTSDSVDELVGENGKLTKVNLKSGGTLDADLFVIAIGVRPNVGWLRDSGITIDRGIIVDEYMRTNLKNVYAAGDCAQGLEVISGSRMVLATIPIATEHGTIAGFNMAGRKVRYKGGIPMNSLQFGEVQLISYGYVKEKDNQQVMSIYDEKKQIYKKLVLENDKITGALFLRAIDRAGLFRFLIEEKINVRDFQHKLLADNFGVASFPNYLREYMFGYRQSRIVS